jgi:hypothetical protein
VVKEMKDKWITRGKMGKERNKSRDGEAQVWQIMSLFSP